MSEDPGIAIDTAHAHLLYGLVCAHKPASILEFGFGAGIATQAMLRAAEYNGNAPEFLVVDNWTDWDGVQPPEAVRFAQDNGGRVRFVNTSERDAVSTCHLTYDFIVSDADHEHAQEWFAKVYADLLAPGGILVYHDVCLYANLGVIVDACRMMKLRYVLFNKSSLESERCERGLLVIFKSLE